MTVRFQTAVKTVLHQTLHQTPVQAAGEELPLKAVQVPLQRLDSGQEETVQKDILSLTSKENLKPQAAEAEAQDMSHISEILA